MAIRTVYPKPWQPPRFQAPSSSSAGGSIGAVGSGDVGDGGGPPRVGFIHIFPEPLGAHDIGTPVTLTAVRTNGTAPITWSWYGPPGTSAPISSTSNILSWTVGANDGGTYVAVASSPGAPDTPQQGAVVIQINAAPPGADIGLVTVTGEIVPPAPPVIADPDVIAYIAAVEAADGDALEDAVKTAINGFVIALKATTGWAAFNTFLPIVGARTIAGAMVPLKGSAPIAQNFVAGDYSRKTGIKGDGISKAGSIPMGVATDSNHMAAHFTGFAFNDMYPLGFRFVRTPPNDDFNTLIQFFQAGNMILFYNWSSESINANPIVTAQGFLGSASNSATAIERWHQSVDVWVPSSLLPPAQAPATMRCGIMARWQEGNLHDGFGAGTMNCVSTGAYYNQPMQVRAAINNYLAALAIAIP
jgi:hypothetical protein